MYLDTQHQSIEALDRSRFEIITSHYDYFRKSNGFITSEFKEHFPHLMICKFEEKPINSPAILLVGSQSCQRDVFGHEWANDVVSIRKTPDIKLETISALAYEQAAIEGHACDLCEGVLATTNGPEVVTFMRYISTIKTHQGFPLFSVAGLILNRARLQ